MIAAWLMAQAVSSAAPPTVTNNESPAVAETRDDRRIDALLNRAQQLMDAGKLDAADRVLQTARVLARTQRERADRESESERARADRAERTEAGIIEVQTALRNLTRIPDADPPSPPKAASSPSR